MSFGGVGSEPCMVNRAENIEKIGTSELVPSETQKRVTDGAEHVVEKGHPYIALGTVTGVVLLMNYVLSMVIPAIPTIERYFSTTPTNVAWITSGFVLVGAASATLLGKLGDVYGKKRLFLMSLLIFSLSVGLAGFSQSMNVLVALMAVGGMGFALFPLGLAIITDVFSKERLATAQGIIAGAAGISSAAGLVLGSLVVQDFGWRYAFYTTIPLSAAMFVLSAMFLKSTSVRIKMKMDYTGALMLIGGIALSLLYLNEGSSLGWFSYKSAVFLIVGLLLIVGFFLFERSRANPLIKLRLLRIRNVLAANFVTIMSGLANFLLFYAFVYYAEYPRPFGLGLNVLSTGIALAPATVAMIIFGPISGRIMTRVGPKPILIMGSLILAIGFSLLMVDRSSTIALSTWAAVSMAGVVSLLVPLINMISVSLPKESVSAGLGFNIMLKSVGQAIGPILATTVMTTYSIPVTKEINGRMVVIAHLASSTGFNIIFGIGVSVSILIAIISLILVKNYAFSGGKSKREDS